MKTPATAFELEQIQFESIKRIIAKVKENAAISHLSILVLMIFVYSTANFTEWLVSIFSIAAIGLVRQRYILNCIQAQAEDLRKVFYSNIKLFWISGIIWGSLAFLFYGNTNVITTFIYAVYILAHLLISAIYLSSYLPALKRFITGYCIGLLGALFIKMIDGPVFNSVDALVVFVVGIIWLSYVIFNFGKQLNIEKKSGILLEIRNTNLIESLTIQTNAALAGIQFKNRFMASTAHDMRQPVLALDLYANWLDSEPQLYPEFIPKILASTKAVLSMFDSMFDSSQLAVGLINPEISAVDLGALMRELAVQFQPMAHENNLSFRTRFIEKQIYSDPILLKRIVGNLISNAIKYTEEGGVLVTSRQTTKGVSILVYDTGLGISEDQQTLVFDEFYKNTENSGTSEGFGLGLSIVQQLAKLLDYKITMKSTRGVGTIMRLDLGPDLLHIQSATEPNYV